MPSKQAATLKRMRRSPPMLGQDNDYVYREVMRYSDAEYAVAHA